MENNLYEDIAEIAFDLIIAKETWTYDDLAEELGRSPQRMKSLVKKAYDAMKAAGRDDEAEDIAEAFVDNKRERTSASPVAAPLQAKGSLEEALGEMKVWMKGHPEETQAAVEWLEQECAEAPMHASLLSELTRRFGIPKPTSAFVRLCPSLYYYGAKVSPNHHPCVIRKERMQDEAYLGRVATGGTGAMPLSPWAALGVSPRDVKSLDLRIQIFHAFLETTYGINIGKDMAAVCADFKRSSGMAFNAFFNGLRPADLQRLAVANNTLEWSWSNSVPPVLSCRAKRVYTVRPDITPELIGRLVPIAAKTHPEMLEVEALATQLKVSPQDILASYLPALKEALSLRVAQAKEAACADHPDMPQVAARLAAIAATLARATQEVAELAQLVSKVMNSQANV